jgi:uncharacterized damage-inducible protein DinB
MKKDEFFQYAVDGYRPVENMMKMVPADKLDWKPGESFMSLGQLLRHLADGIGTELEMLVRNSWPQQVEGQGMPSCSARDALSMLERDKATLRALLDGVTEEEFAEKVVSTPWGASGKLEKMAFFFQEHFTNHKMQLFTYLKLLGLPVNTQTLYMG